MARWVRQSLVVITAAALVGAGCGSDPTEAPTVADGTPAEPAEYAEQAGAICDETVDAAESASADDDDPGRAAELLRTGAGELAALTPPVDRREMAQALVDSLAAYADLYGRRDENREAFSQDQNELAIVIRVRATGLDAECPSAGIQIAEPEPPQEGLGTFSEDEFGVDPEADALAQRCFEGELAACDEVSETDAYRLYGVMCGGRIAHEEANNNYDCVETFVGDEPVRGQVVVGVSGDDVF